MRPLDHPASLTPEQRFSELAGILAAGLLRLARGSSSSPHFGHAEAAGICCELP
jgi:hypothetical protein